MPAVLIEPSFSGGELAPSLWGRVDIPRYKTSAAFLENFFVDYRGGVSNRPGSYFIAPTKCSGNPLYPARLIPFIIGQDNSYVLEFGQEYIRFYQDGQQLAGPLEVDTPYLASDLPLLKYAQSADVLTLVHPSYPPATLTLTDPTVPIFVYAEIDVGPTIQPPTNLVATAQQTGIYWYGYVVTSISLDGKEQSLPCQMNVIQSKILDETNNVVITLTWDAPSLPISLYKIYKWGPIDGDGLIPATVWGFIGSSQVTSFVDNNIAPDFSTEPPSWGDPFSGGQFQAVGVATGGNYFGAYVPLTVVGDGTGAAGYAVINASTDSIVGVFLTNSGANYTTATITADPAAAIGNTGGPGTGGATFTYQLSAIEPLYPAATVYFQQRSTFGGSNLKPETLVMSVIAEYANFCTTPVSQPSDALVIDIASLQVNTIKSFAPIPGPVSGLMIFTEGGTFLLTGGNAGLSPSNIDAIPQASYGASDLPSITVNYAAIYQINKGNRIYELSFAWQRQSFVGVDISIYSSHLFTNFEITEWTFAQEPFRLVWCVRDDGALLTMAYLPDQEITGWSHHFTQGIYQSVCAVPEGDTYGVYAIVQRLVNGTWVSYVEEFADRRGCCSVDMCFLDSATSAPVTQPDYWLSLSGSSGSVDITLSAEI